MAKKKIVFLYTELASYFLSCVESLVFNGIEVHIIRLPVNKEAPFAFSFPKDIKVYNRNEYDSEMLLALVTDIKPDIIVCSGWVDKGYMKICKLFKKKAITILTLDNHWRGDIRQRIASLISPFYLLNRFLYCWVPGILQEEFALKLGFKKAKILTGFYSCDFNLFHNLYISNKVEKENNFPKRFIYVGRYVEHKGIKDLWNAFIELQNEYPNDWELWCLGTGDVKPIEHSKIKHFGFVQPNAMKNYISNTGVFVLPSHFEPWGVVIHEYAAAGFPVICTDEAGARTAFVENNLNGYIYKSGDIEALKQALLRIVKDDPSHLLMMSENSVKKAEQITPEIWAKKLISLL